MRHRSAKRYGRTQCRRPADRRIELRVGVHLGDVVEESDGDLMGDGLNIAARLEGVFESGAICLSEDAYRQVRGRLYLAVSDLSQTQLKKSPDRSGFIRFESASPAQAKAPIGAKLPSILRWG
jgi:adenylate cyclase